MSDIIDNSKYVSYEKAVERIQKLEKALFSIKIDLHEIIGINKENHNQGRGDFDITRAVIDCQDYIRKVLNE